MSTLNPKTIPEAVEQLEKLLKHYFEKLGWKALPVEKFGDFSEDAPEDSDLCVMINSWLIITPFLKTENTTIFLKNFVTSIHYRISKEVFFRSCHRDDPDEVDIVDVETDIKGLLPVIEKAIHLVIQNDLDGIGENIETDDMIQEEEEFSKQEGI
jgi:hypothetical protein